MALRTEINPDRRCPECGGPWLAVEHRRHTTETWRSAGGSCLRRCVRAEIDDEIDERRSA